MFVRKLICCSFLLTGTLFANNLADLDQNLLSSAKDMKIESIEEAISTYERLRNTQMVQALAEILLARDPENEMGKKFATPQVLRALEKEASMPTPPDAANAVAVAAAAVATPFDTASNQFYPALEKKDWAAAEAAIGELEKANPENEHATLWRAQILLDQEKPAEALALVDAPGAKLPQDGSVEMLKGYALVSLERGAEAAQMIAPILSNPTKHDAGMVKEAQALELSIKANEAEIALDKALEAKNAAAARTELAKYVAANGDKDNAVLLESRVCLLEGNNTDAVAKLSQVKKKYASKPFPAQMDLANAYLSLGNYAEASAALEEILSTQGYEEETKKHATGSLRDVYTENKQAVQVDALMFAAGEGDAYYLRGTYRTDWENGRRWQVWARLDDIQLSRSESYVRKCNTTALEGGVRVNQHDGDLLWGASLGAAEDHPILGASVGNRGTEGWRWNAEGSFNEIVSSSLQLQAINARQHRLAVSVEKQIAPKWYFDLTAHARYVHIDYAEFGKGLGAEYSFLYNAISDADGNARLRFGYLGNVQYFDGQNSDELSKYTVYVHKNERGDLPKNLMERNINQHGLLAELRGQLTGQSTWSLGGAALYDTFDKRFEYVGRAQLESWVTKNCRVSLGVEYLSSGQGANNDDSIVIATAGVLFAF